MKLKTYFTRPGNTCDIYRDLKSEITSAKERILVSMAFFSDRDLMKAIKNNNNVKDKRVILNKADLFRKDKEGRYNSNCLQWANESTYIVTLGTIAEYSSNMHHKIIIIDDVIWTGSYNFTSYAKESNWENMIRISDDKEVFQDFINEFDKMYRLGMVFEDWKDVLNKNKCIECSTEKIDDPFNHYYFSVEDVNIISLKYGSMGSGHQEYIYDRYVTFKTECKGQAKPFQDNNCNQCHKPFKGKELSKVTIHGIYGNPENCAMHYDIYMSSHFPDTITEEYWCLDCLSSSLQSKRDEQMQEKLSEEKFFDEMMRNEKK